MNMELVFRVLFGVIFLSGFSMTAAYRRRAQAGQKFSLEQEGAAVAIPLRLAGLIVWLYPLAYIVYPAVLGWSRFDVPAWLRFASAGTGLFFCLPAIAWAQKHLGSNVSPTVTTRPSHELVTTGPYHVIRHPLYTFGTVFFVSLSLLAGSWLMLAAGAVGLVMVAIRTPREEAMLVERFGDAYRAYMASTGRFLPRLR